MNKKFVFIIIITLLVIQLVGCYTETVSLKLIYDVGETKFIEVSSDVDQYILPTPSKEGYTFLGWKDELGKVAEYGIWDKSFKKNLTAVWSANTYLLTLDYNNESNKTEMRNVTFDSYVYLPNAYKSRYYFAGWVTPENELVVTGNWKIANNITLKASWSRPVFTIVLDYNDGITPNGELTVTYGEQFSLPYMERDNMCIEGWYTDNDYKITESIWERDPVEKLTAKWMRKPDVIIVT